jgi:aromatic ring-opening dioxygenase catalytic subunit (LigB family)
MDNSYFSNVGSYMQPVNPQEQQGLMPVFQNIAAQQANQNAALAQQNQLTQQAGQTGQQGGGMNPMAMAAMLRKKPGQADMNAQDAQMGGLSTYNPFTQYSISQQYGTDMYSPQSRMLAAQER